MTKLVPRLLIATVLLAGTLPLLPLVGIDADSVGQSISLRQGMVVLSMLLLVLHVGLGGVRSVYRSLRNFISGRG